ncbi:strictosidine synthase [Actinocorallia herbida]|uniref:Strictosidine synthase n=1 Tax=Actinocorallia herbida TaxID=58109 RepID=A0A3N1CYP8_9ACTN|nr:SMP-30/gluconolactonase/LRE family protein [Actinocorallia herbida]ROO86356.1 strictosidine synthase [Actinocorallia herbida]
MTKPALDPFQRRIPAAPPRSREERGPTPFPRTSALPLRGRAPEDVVVDGHGRLLCGVEGGAVLRVDPLSGAQEEVGNTGGRPLGLETLDDGRVLVCDADRGLLRLDPETGHAETLVADVAGVPLRFCSNAVAEADGTVWFTESTTRFAFAHYMGAILEHRPSGRLLRRSPTGEVDVVLDALYFANGLSLTPDGAALLLAETIGPTLSRVALTGHRAGVRDVVAPNLPGYPDNLSRFTDGRAWVALTNPRDPALDRLASAPAWAARALWALPDRLRPAGRATTWILAVDEHGAVLHDLQTPDAAYPMVTGVAEHDGDLYLAGLPGTALLRVHLSETP